MHREMGFYRVYTEGGGQELRERRLKRERGRSRVLLS